MSNPYRYGQLRADLGDHRLYRLRTPDSVLELVDEGTDGPELDHVRLGLDEQYLGRTISGRHVILPAPAKETRIPRELLRPDGSVDLQKILARSEAAIASGKAALAEAQSGFVTRACARCGRKFET